jgi:hypothetical protein
MSKLLSPLVVGKVVGGKFVPKDAATFKKAFWAHEGKQVDITVKRHRENRSLNQNSYYWYIVVAMIGQAIGEDDAEAVHDMLKLEHNYYIATVGKKEIRVPMSTAELDTAAFEAYLERVRRWASEFLSLYIPLPNEVEH